MKSSKVLRLQVVVPLLMAGVGLVVAALFLVIELRQTSERTVGAAIRQLGVLSGIMVETVEKGLRRGDATNVRDALRPIRANRTTDAAAVFDDRDRVIHSTDHGAAGSALNRTRFAGETVLVDSVRRSGRPQFRVDEKTDRIVWAHPFAMPALGGELLSSRTGVLLVRYSLDVPRYEILRDAFSRTSNAMILVALLCAIVTWIFYRSFTPRIAALVESTEKIAAGDYRDLPEIAGNDELARIGHAITEMADKLDRDHRRLLHSEAELRALNNDLEDRVRERTAELAAYALDMESFAFMISHDLRTPLRSIAGFAQVLAQDNAATIGQEGLENLGRVLLNAKRMNRLMDDILALSRHGRQQIQTSAIDMTALVKSVAAELLGDQKHPERIQIRIDEVPPAVADEGLLRQVLQNLLSNAIKYTGVRETAEIHFGATNDRRGPIYFLSDNGVGFAMKYATQVFAPFKRLHAPSEYEGTGVGLAIVKRVMQRHGGSVWVRSQFGTGTTFHFAFFTAVEASEAVHVEQGSQRRVGETLPVRAGA
jgi:signal transduction histidine kinase